MSNSLSDFYSNKNSLLQKSLHQFVEKTKFFPQIGVELEFYLLDENSQRLENQGLVADYITVLSHLFLQDPTIYKIEKEQGATQIEIKIAPHSDLILLAEKIAGIKEVAKKLAQKNNFIACFDAQPFVDDCGSALQFNFSLHDVEGENLFTKVEDFLPQNKEISAVKNSARKNKLLLHSIAGMLDSLEWAMIFYAPKEEDYRRFDLEINRKLHHKGKFTAPTNISFGDNNRTAAIRLPRNEYFQNDRIEFRVAAADADPFLVLFSLLTAVENGIENNQLPQDSQRVFGNAFDAQYSFKEFAKNLEIAQKNFIYLAQRLSPEILSTTLLGSKI